MNLTKKKDLAARTLGTGKSRISFVKSRLDEVKEAITRQDIRDLVKEGAIKIKERKGKRKVVRKKRKKGPGKIKKKVKRRKQEYAKITRKLRRYIMNLRDNGKLDRESYWELRKKIRSRQFESLAQLKAYLKNERILK